MTASVPDLFRLLAVPFFGYVAWRDVKTRRVPSRLWYPLAALAVVLLGWEFYTHFSGTPSALVGNLFLIQVAVSIGIVVPLAYLFWLVGGFGGADAKAFFVIAVLFPTYPTYEVADFVLPVVVTTLGVFSLTILSNTVLVGLVYPVLVGLRNAVGGHRSPGMFVATTLDRDETTDSYGTMLHFSDRSLRSDLSLSGLRAYFAWRGLDLDALRMYLQWRETSLSELCENPAMYRDPVSLPDETNDPGDGSLNTLDHPLLPDGGASTDADSVESTRDYTDPWGAEAFLDDIEGTAYGTTPGKLREGLDTLVSEETVWVSPGIPFLVPLFWGLVVSLTFGDVLFAMLSFIGIA